MRKLTMFSMEAGDSNYDDPQFQNDVSTASDAQLLAGIITMDTLKVMSFSRLNFMNEAVSAIICEALTASKLKCLLLCTVTFPKAVQPFVAKALAMSQLEKLSIDCCAGVPT
jgi:hypothetical protein